MAWQYVHISGRKMANELKWPTCNRMKGNPRRAAVRVRVFSSSPFQHFGRSVIKMLKFNQSGSRVVKVPSLETPENA